MAETRKRSFWPAAIAVLGMVAAAGVVAFHFAATSRTSARLAALEAENRDLHMRSEAAARQLESLRQNVPQPLRAAPPEPRERGAEPAGSIENARLLIQLREKFVAANASIQALETRVRELEAAVEKAAEENRRLAASEADLKETLATTNRVLEAVRAELKGKDERLAQIMITNTKLLEDNRAQAGRLDQLQRVLRELEELNRRREGYLNSILRRYREVTEQYRSLGGETGASTELSRIQNAISMAEEDLRQLSSLNAQASRLQQRVAR